LPSRAVKGFFIPVGTGAAVELGSPTAVRVDELTDVTSDSTPAGNVVFPVLEAMALLPATTFDAVGVFLVESASLVITSAESVTTTRATGIRDHRIGCLFRNRYLDRAECA
jgi:hypothetical protein